MCRKSQQSSAGWLLGSHASLAALPYLLLALASGCFIEPNPSPTNDPDFPGATNDTVNQLQDAASAADVNSPPPPDVSGGVDATGDSIHQDAVHDIGEEDVGDTDDAGDADDAGDVDDAGDAGIGDIRAPSDVDAGPLGGASDCSGCPTEGADI